MRLTAALFAFAGCAASVLAQITGPSTTVSPYMIPSDPSSGVQFISIATSLNTEFHKNRDTGANTYRLVGIPDGMGVYRDAEDIANNTFTLLVNHELGDSNGIARAHGNEGAFVSQWRIRRNDLGVFDARDLTTNTNLFTNGGTFQNFNSSNPMPDYVQSAADPSGISGNIQNGDGFGRFCSGDLAPISAYQWTDAFGNTFGTADRIYLNGEERGPSGRAFAHIATGNEARTTWELPDLADFSWENSVASPLAQRKTVVAGLDDSTEGQLYFYVGDKQASGNAITKAGLMGGKTYGMAVSGLPLETPGSVLNNVPFSMVDLSATQRADGGTFESVSAANGVTEFARPEDGAWDPNSPNDFYWLTTGATQGGGNVATRIYRTRFTDITNPELGGTITMMGQGNDLSSFSGGITSAAGATDGVAFDNMAMSRFGQILIQEDPGSSSRLSRLWLYDIVADSLVDVGISDTQFFTTGAPGFLTTNEETSGIIDAWDILGPGWWLLNMQAHYGISGELVEGGQLMAVFIPQTVPTPAGVALLGLAGLAAARRRR